MKRLLLPMIVGLFGATLFLTSVALAAPSHPAALPVTGGRFQLGDTLTETETISDTDSISDTESISHTTSVSHPVVSALAKYFDVEASEIAALHDEGLGFGVIAHAYFVGETLGILPSAVLAEFQAGKGWGEIMKDYGLHPGLAGRGGNLGMVMSGHDRTLPPGQLKKLSPDEANTFIPPGQLKKNQDQDGFGFVPPGQLKKSGGDVNDQDGIFVPPGHGKDKGNKGKKH